MNEPAFRRAFERQYGVSLSWRRNNSAAEKNATVARNFAKAIEQTKTRA